MINLLDHFCWLVNVSDRESLDKGFLKGADWAKISEEELLTLFLHALIRLGEKKNVDILVSSFWQIATDDWRREFYKSMRRDRSRANLLGFGPEPLWYEVEALIDQLEGSL